MVIPATPDDDLGLVPGALEEIEESECWRLLATQPVGRMAVIVGHYPLVFPVNYAVDGRHIFFRTGAGTKLWAIHRSNVTFEADELDVVNRTGWSVMVRGAARELSAEHNPDLVARAELSRAVPWAAGTKDSIVRIVADAISGRRIRPPAAPLIADIRL
jgi:nitroimidazol reductase NimA-like FMN-containing flavoprotein (pyridoxamine 5'-phosphate oxidase superfamily)